MIYLFSILVILVCSGYFIIFCIVLLVCFISSCVSSLHCLFSAVLCRAWLCGVAVGLVAMVPFYSSVKLASKFFVFDVVSLS